MHRTETEAGNILIIDDDPLCCELLKSYIESRTSYAADACLSLADLGSIGMLADYDLIIIDYELEDMTGIEIAEYLDAFFPHKPAIVITGNSFLPAPSNHLPKSVRIFVSKSIGPEGVVEIVRELKVCRRGAQSYQHYSPV